MSNAQHWALNKQPTAPADLTAVQKLAYRQTGVPMSDQDATSHLLAQLSLQQLRDLHASHTAGNTTAASTAATRSSAFAAPSCGYADTGADALDSNFASLRDLPPTSIDQIQREAQIATDAELLDYIGTVLRNRWTKAAALLLACAVTLLVMTDCSGDHREEGSFSPALAPAASATAATH